MNDRALIEELCWMFVNNMVNDSAFLHRFVRFYKGPICVVYVLIKSLCSRYVSNYHYVDKIMFELYSNHIQISHIIDFKIKIHDVCYICFV